MVVKFFCDHDGQTRHAPAVVTPALELLLLARAAEPRERLNPHTHTHTKAHTSLLIVL